MDINSEEFRKKFSNLFEQGYCAHCVAILTSPFTIGNLCNDCEKIFYKEK